MRLPRFGVSSDQVLAHASSSLLAVFLFYCVIFAANLLEIPFYLGYKKFIVDITILTPSVDRFLWVSSVAAFSTMILAWRLKGGLAGLRRVLVVLYGLVLIAAAYVLIFGFDVVGTVFLIVSGFAFVAFSFVFGGLGFPFVLVVFYGMLVLLGVEVASFGCWVYHLFFPSVVFGDGSWGFAFAEVQIWSILYPLLPGLLMFFSFSWVGEFTFKGLLTKGDEEKSADSRLFSESVSRRASLIIASVAVGAALFIGYYNFAISGVFNPGFPGVDVHLHYTKYLREVSGMSLMDALSHAAKNDRFLYLAFQYFCFQLLGGSIDRFVIFVMPVILIFLLMLSTYMLVRIGRSRLHAATAMLATVFSFQVAVGLYSAFYANWFALSFVYVFYGLLMTVLRGRRDVYLLVLTGLASVSVLYVHPWTWILLVMIIMAAYILVTSMLIWIRKTGFEKDAWGIKFLSLLLAVNIVTFYVKELQGIGSGAEFINIEGAGIHPNLLNALRLEYSLERTFNLYVGGFYAYIPMILLAIIGVLSFLDYEDRYNRLLLTWMLISSSMVFVDFPWHARFLYLTPFSIYVALGTFYGAEQLLRFADPRGQRRMAPLAFWVFYVLSILLMLNYTVRCVTIKQFGPSGLTVTP